MLVSFVQADSGVNGETYAYFDQPFISFTIPAKGTANSGKFGNVLLTKGALLSLVIIPLKYLDVFAAATVMCVSIPRRREWQILIRMRSLRIGDGGYTIPWLHLTQLNVPTNYDLAGLSLSGFKQATTISDKAPEAVSNALSAASLVESGADSVPSVPARIIRSTGMEGTNMTNSISGVSLQI